MAEDRCTRCDGPFAQHLFFEQYCPACEGTARFVGASVLRPPTDTDPDGLTPEQRAYVDRIDAGESALDFAPDAQPVTVRFAPGVRLRRTTERQRDELRAIVGPLLDDPIQVGTWEVVDQQTQFLATLCLFCRSAADHVASCPVLRRDELLGRS